MPKSEYAVHIPETVDVKAVRARIGLPQAGFAARFGLSLHTLELGTGKTHT